jgi:hypothetical protein
MLLEGNFQCFCFLLFSQISMGFSLSPRDKAFNIFDYFVYFLIIWFAVISCFLAKKRLAQYILDSWRTSFKGLLAFSLTNTVRSLALGALHSLLRDHPLQLPLLFGVETVYLIIMLLSMGYWRAHMVSFKVSFNVGFALLRMALQATLYLQQSEYLVGSGSSPYYLVEDILGTIINLYMILFYLATFWSIIFEFVELIRPLHS